MIVKFLKFIVYVFCMALVVIVIRLSGVANTSSSWRSIGQIPGTVTELFYVFPNIYVRTSDDILYTCNERLKSCALAVPDAVPPNLLADRYCYKPEIDLSQVPGKVVTSLSLRECAADGYVDLHMIALDDGTIWTQSSGSNAISVIVQFLFIAVIGFIGLVIGIFAFWRSVRRVSQEKQKR